MYLNYLSPMKSILISLQKDFKNEWRNFYQVGGLLCFLMGICYLIYFFGDKNQSISEWNLKYWLCYLYLSFFIGSRIFEDDMGRFRYFIHQLLHPLNLLISKIVFVFTLLMLINILLLIFFSIFNPEIQLNWLQWVLMCVMVNIGMSALICFSSLINSHIKNSTLLLTIIILPISFPLIGMAYSSSISLLEGISLFSLGSKIRIVLAIDLMIVSFSLLLYSHLIRT